MDNRGSAGGDSHFLAEGPQPPAGLGASGGVALGGCSQGYLSVPFVIISKIKAK